MAGKIESTIRELIAPQIEAMGFDLVDIEYKKEGTQKILYVYADRPGGITLEECEKISRSIEPVLDQSDPISERYYLCVSSPGLDRPFRTVADYRRNVGKAIEIKLYAPYFNKKDYSGILKSVDDEHIILETGGQEISFRFADIARARLAIEF